jgi:hypothetical protein
MTGRFSRGSIVAGLVTAAAVSAALYINVDVKKTAGRALTDYNHGADSPDLNNYLMVELADKTIRLVNRSTGRFVDGPLVFTDYDGRVFAVHDKALLQLSGGVFWNLAIWFGYAHPQQIAKAP